MSISYSFDPKPLLLVAPFVFGYRHIKATFSPNLEKVDRLGRERILFLVRVGHAIFGVMEIGLGLVGIGYLVALVDFLAHRVFQEKA